jgi:hypothetical protein
MSAFLTLHLEGERITKIRIPANDLRDQLAAVDFLRGGLVEMVKRFNEVQIQKNTQKEVVEND